MDIAIDNKDDDKEINDLLILIRAIWQSLALIWSTGFTLKQCTDELQRHKDRGTPNYPNGHYPKDFYPKVFYPNTPYLNGHYPN